MDTTTLRTRPRVLKALIETRGYAPLARQVGTSAGYLHDIAHGRRNGSPSILRALANELGVELEDISDATPETCEDVA